MIVFEERTGGGTHVCAHGGGCTTGWVTGCTTGWTAGCTTGWTTGWATDS